MTGSKNDPALAVNTEYVSVGACMEGGADRGDPLKFKRCAVAKETCQGGEYYLTGQDLAWLTQSDQHPAFGKCNSLEHVHGGRCQDNPNDLLLLDSDENNHQQIAEPWTASLCMNGVAQNCHKPEAMIHSSSIFSDDYVGCNLVKDNKPNKNQTTTDTQYSKCQSANKEEFVCRWGTESCPEWTVGLLPYQSGSDCPCEKVQTGACIYGNDNGNPIIDCAVAASACGAYSTYLTPEQLHSTYTMDCRLCRSNGQDTTPKLPGKSTKVTTYNESSPVLSRGVFIAATILLILLVLTLIPLVVYSLRRCFKEKEAVTEKDGFIDMQKRHPPSLKMRKEAYRNELELAVQEEEKAREQQARERDYDGVMA